MRYRAAAVVLALAAAVAIGQVPMYSDYPWGLLNNGVDQGPVWNLDCKPPLWCDVPTYGNGRVRLGDGGVLPIEVEFARFANDAGFAQGAGLATFALDAGRAGFAIFAQDAGRSFISNFSDYAADAGSAGFAVWAGDAGFAVGSGLAQYALDAGLASKAFAADFARDAGSAASADLATAALWAGDAGFANGAALAAYALDAGLASKAFAADFARDAGSAAVADLATASLWAGDAGFAVGSGLAQYALDAGLASKAFAADFARDAGSAANADFARDAGSAALADLSTFALDAGRAVFAGFAADAGLAVAALYAGDAGLSVASLYAADAGRSVFAVFAADAGLSARATLADTATVANYASLAADSQDLNCTTCVDTADIAAGAVTATELGNMSVTPGKLPDGVSLSAYDEATPAALHSRSSVVNGTKGTFDGTLAYVAYTATTATASMQVTTGLYTGTSTNQFTADAVVRFRARNTAIGKLASITAVNTGNTAQTASMAGFSLAANSDGNWYVGVFDLSAWTTVGTLRVDFGWTGNSAPAGAIVDISYAGTGNAGSGTGALVSYQGNVGIGSTTPGYKLTLAGETAQYPTSLSIAATGHATSRRAGAFLGDWLLGQDSNGNGTKDFFIYDGNIPATRLYISTSGNVGINNGGPNYRLDVTGATLGGVAGNESAVQRLYAASTNGDQIITRLRRASTGSSWDTADWQMFRRVDSTDMAGIQFNRSQGIDLVTGGTTARLTVASGGNVGIGTTSTGEEKLEVRTGSSAYGLLHSNGTIKVGSYISTEGQLGTKSNHDLALFTNNGAARLRVTAAGEVRLPDYAGGGTTTASIDNNGRIIRTVSDERLKESISDLPRGLDAVLRMRPVRFQWKDKEAYGDRWDIGFIAQEMISCVPEAVSKTPEGMYSLDYGKLIAVVVGAIKELFDDRTWLARRVQELEDRAQKAEDKLAQLEARLLSLENYSGIKGCGDCPQTDDGGADGR